jgi:hypothetical protein
MSRQLRPQEVRGDVPPVIEATYSAVRSLRHRHYTANGSGLTPDEPILGHPRELRMGGELLAARAIHRIAWREPRHTRSDGFNGAGEIDAQSGAWVETP